MLIRAIKTQLQLSDFKAVGVGAGAVSLFRGNEEAQEQIIISYNKYPGEYRLGPTIAGWKSFSAVEDVVEKYFRQHNIGYNGVTIHCVSRRDEQMFDTSVTKAEDVLRILPSLEKMVYEDILQFFEKYEHLESVYNQTREYNNDFSKINKLLYPPQPIRRIIINRLSGDPMWKEYARSVYEAFKGAASGQHEKMYTSYAKVVSELIDELESSEFDRSRVSET